MKYIVLNNITPILFPDWVQHDLIPINSSNKITSAGFFRYENGKVECYGMSQSLNLIPNYEEDEFLIKNIFYKEEK